MAVMKELPLKKIKPLPIQTRRGYPPPPPPSERSGAGAAPLPPAPAAPRRAALPTSPSSMGCLFLPSGREPGIVSGRDEAGSSAAGLPHLLLGPGQHGSSGPASGGAPHAEPRPPRRQARLRRESTLSAIHLNARSASRQRSTLSAIHLKGRPRPRL